MTRKDQKIMAMYLGYLPTPQALNMPNPMVKSQTDNCTSLNRMTMLTMIVPMTMKADSNSCHVFQRKTDNLKNH